MGSASRAAPKLPYRPPTRHHRRYPKAVSRSTTPNCPRPLSNPYSMCQRNPGAAIAGNAQWLTESGPATRQEPPSARGKHLARPPSAPAGPVGPLGQGPRAKTMPSRRPQPHARRAERCQWRVVCVWIGVALAKSPEPLQAADSVPDSAPALVFASPQARTEYEAALGAATPKLLQQARRPPGRASTRPAMCREVREQPRRRTEASRDTRKVWR